MKKATSYAKVMTDAIADTSYEIQKVLEDIKGQEKPTEEQMIFIWEAYADIQEFMKKLDKELTALDRKVDED